MFKKIVHREGLGDVLADGMSQAAERLGGEAKDHAHHMKGLPLYTPFDPPALVTGLVKGSLGPDMGNVLNAVVSSRGDLMRSRGAWFPDELRFFAESYQNTTAEDTAANIRRIIEQVNKEAAEASMAPADVIKKQVEEEAERIAQLADGPIALEGWTEGVVHYENTVTIGDCLSACKAMAPMSSNAFDEKYQTAFLSAGTGIETGAATLHEVAGRVKHLERAFCVREGMTRETDSLPRQFTDKPLEEGPFKGMVLKTSDVEALKDRYYALRGWDLATGIPTRETLEAAGLGDVAHDLEERGKLPKKSPERAKRAG
jgi:aldehyde:ferredoxin oxidoreductase